MTNTSWIAVLAVVAAALAVLLFGLVVCGCSWCHQPEAVRAAIKRPRRLRLHLTPEKGIDKNGERVVRRPVAQNL